LELSKIPKFNLTAENFPKTTHQDKEWSILIHDINERDVIIWDVLVAIISRNILRNCLGWQSFINQQIRDRIFGNFTYFSGRT
jgi:hypothetical protein